MFFLDTVYIALVYTPQSYATSPAIWDHTMLPVTQHR